MDELPRLTYLVKVKNKEFRTMYHKLEPVFTIAFIESPDRFYVLHEPQFLRKIKEARRRIPLLVYFHGKQVSICFIFL